jgi:hypothetical protein
MTFKNTTGKKKPKGKRKVRIPDLRGRKKELTREQAAKVKGGILAAIAFPER